MDTFSDSRLHVSVRPCLEYRIPEICTIARDVILGDRKAEDLRAACDQCSMDMKHVTHVKRVDTGHDTRELQQMCALVCSHTDEYLRHLSASWKTYLDKMFVTVRHRTNEIQSETDHVVHLCKHHPRRHASGGVRNEFREEFRRLRNNLNAMLHEVRCTATPSMQRPEELVRTAQTLRDMFASTYGTMATDDILAIKQEFEDQMCNIQHRVATRFIKQVLEFIT